MEEANVRNGGLDVTIDEVTLIVEKGRCEYTFLCYLRYRKTTSIFVCSDHVAMQEFDTTVPSKHPDVQNDKKARTGRIHQTKEKELFLTSQTVRANTLSSTQPVLVIISFIPLPRPFHNLP